MTENSNLSDSEISKLLSNAKRIAIVGLSENPTKPSNQVARYLLSHNYEIYPVNPKYENVLGYRCYPDLESIEKQIDIVNFFQRSERMPLFVDSLINLKAPVVWMQLGVVNSQIAEKLALTGIKVVMDRCIKIEHARLMGVN